MTDALPDHSAGATARSEAEESVCVGSKGTGDGVREIIACVEVEEYAGLLTTDLDSEDVGDGNGREPLAGSWPPNSTLAVSSSDTPGGGVYGECGHGSTNSKVMIVRVVTWCTIRLSLVREDDSFTDCSQAVRVAPNFVKIGITKNCEAPVGVATSGKLKST